MHVISLHLTLTQKKTESLDCVEIKFQHVYDSVSGFHALFHGTHKLSNSTKFSLKLGLIALFIHLKIILL